MLPYLCPVQRRFLGNLFILQALNWLIKPVWIFWIDRLAQIQLGDELYGRYYVVFSFGLLFNILLDMGLNNYVAAQVGRTADPAMAKPVFKLRTRLAALYVVLLVVLGLWQQFDPAILAFAIANQVLAGFVLLFRAVLQGRHLFRTDSLISVTDRLVAIILCAMYLYSSGFSGKTGVLVFLGTQTAGYLIALILAIYFAWHHHKPASQIVQPVSNNALLKQVTWFAVMAFAMAVFTRVDAVMIRHLAVDAYAEAGRYARSYRLLDAAIIFSGLISTMLLPVFSRMIANKENTDSLVWLNTRIVLFASAGVALAAWFFGPDILKLLYGDLLSRPDDLATAQSVFVPVMACFIPMALVHVFGTWLTAAHQLKTLSFFAIGSVVLNATLNFFLIPRYGAMGAGIAGLITQSGFALACIAGSAKYSAFSFHAGRPLILAFWLVVSTISFAVVQHWIKGIEGLLAAGASYFIITMVSGIFFPEIKKAFRS